MLIIPSFSLTIFPPYAGIELLCRKAMDSEHNNASATWEDVSIPIHGVSGPGILVALFLVALPLFYCFSHDKTYHDALPVVNRYFSREPHALSRLRWAVRARKILDNAHEKVGHDSTFNTSEK